MDSRVTTSDSQFLEFIALWIPFPWVWVDLWLVSNQQSMVEMMECHSHDCISHTRLHLSRVTLAHLLAFKKEAEMCAMWRGSCGRQKKGGGTEGLTATAVRNWILPMNWVSLKYTLPQSNLQMKAQPSQHCDCSWWDPKAKNLAKPYSDS